MKKFTGIRLNKDLKKDGLKKWEKEKKPSQHKGIAALVEHLLEKYLDIK